MEFKEVAIFMGNVVCENLGSGWCNLDPDSIAVTEIKASGFGREDAAASVTFEIRNDGMDGWRGSILWQNNHAKGYVWHVDDEDNKYDVSSYAMDDDEDEEEV